MRNILLTTLVVAYVALAACDVGTGRYRTGGISLLFALANYLIFF